MFLLSDTNHTQIYYFYFLMFCFSKTQERKKKKKSFRFAKHNISSKIVGWLVGACDGKILELRIKSRINKESGINPVSLVHMFTICNGEVKCAQNVL